MTSTDDNVTQSSRHNLSPRKHGRLRAPDIDTDRNCNPERTDSIHKALAKLISINQLPLSFY